MADTFQLEIVTPEKLVVKDAAEEAQIPGKNGYLGILARPRSADHRTGRGRDHLSKRTATRTRLAVAWGFAEVLPDKVTILAETAERPQEIDVRARAKSERARRAEASRWRSGDGLRSGRGVAEEG